MHPLVLLSVVDHYHRVAKDTKRRVVGVLLGEVSRGVLDVTNCFAVPFEEDEQDPSVWFMDHSYLENMYAMFKKINGTHNPCRVYKLRILEFGTLSFQILHSPIRYPCETLLHSEFIP